MKGVTSTFGGSALDRYVFDFETVGDASDAGAVGDAAPPDAGVGDAGDLGDAWSAPSQEDWQAMQQSQAETREAIEYFASLMQPPAQQQQGPEPLTVDPLDDGFQSQLDQYLEQKLAPYQEYVQAQQFREGEARAQDILADNIAREGDFVFEGSKEQARQLANNLIVQTNQQHPGDPVKAAEAALELAAKQVREWEEAVGKAYHERQLNQLATLGGARPELGVGANGSQQFTIPQGGSLLDVVKRHTGGSS